MDVERMQQRIMRNVIFYPLTGCWIWIGTNKPANKGRRYASMSMRVKGKKSPITVNVSRVVCEVFKGRKLTNRQVAAHRWEPECRSTLCVCPEHLRGTTQGSNMRDQYRAGHRRQRHEKKIDWLTYYRFGVVKSRV